MQSRALKVTKVNRKSCETWKLYRFGAEFGILYQQKTIMTKSCAKCSSWYNSTIYGRLCVCDAMVPTTAWSLTEASLEFRNYRFTLCVPPPGQSADLSHAQLAAICIISAFLPLFPHTKTELWEPTWIHTVTSVTQLTLCRITAQPNISHVNSDVRLWDVFLTALPVSSGYGFVDFDSPAAAQKAVAALKSAGIQAQMAKVRIHCKIILMSPPLRRTFHNKVPNRGSYLPNSFCLNSLSVGCRMIWPTWF